MDEDLDEEVSGKVIREECQRHDCYDSDHFKDTLRRSQELFVLEGGRKSYTARLTTNGRDEATELAKSLEADE